jgi:hypothetical protein
MVYILLDNYLHRRQENVCHSEVHVHAGETMWWDRSFMLFFDREAIFCRKNLSSTHVKAPGIRWSTWSRERKSQVQVWFPCPSDTVWILARFRRVLHDMALVTTLWPPQGDTSLLLWQSQGLYCEFAPKGWFLINESRSLLAISLESGDWLCLNASYFYREAQWEYTCNSGNTPTSWCGVNYKCILVLHKLEHVNNHV